MIGVRAWWRSPPASPGPVAPNMDVNHGGELDVRSVGALLPDRGVLRPDPVDWDYYHSTS